MYNSYYPDRVAISVLSNSSVNSILLSSCKIYSADNAKIIFKHG